MHFLVVEVVDLLLLLFGLVGYQEFEIGVGEVGVGEEEEEEAKVGGWLMTDGGRVELVGADLASSLLVMCWCGWRQPIDGGFEFLAEYRHYCQF